MCSTLLEASLDQSDTVALTPAEASLVASRSWATLSIIVACLAITTLIVRSTRWPCSWVCLDRTLARRWEIVREGGTGGWRHESWGAMSTQVEENLRGGALMNAQVPCESISTPWILVCITSMQRHTHLDHLLRGLLHGLGLAVCKLLQGLPLGDQPLHRLLALRHTETFENQHTKLRQNTVVE